MYYLIPYCAMSLGAFGVVAARERELGVPVTLENLSGFGWERPFLGVAMWVFMLGFLGFPLTGGFWGKIYVFAAAYDTGWWWLIVIGVVVHDGLGRLLPRGRALDVPARQRRAAARAGRRLAAARAGCSQTGVGACVVVTVGSFFFVQPLVDVASEAASALRSDPAGLGLEQSVRCPTVASSAPQARPGAPSRRGRARPGARARVSRTGRGREAPFDRRRRPPRSRG